jgi:hypothetical protein
MQVQPMNIFAVDKDVHLCARALDDKRLVKMTLETAQIMCTAMQHYGWPDTVYKPTHENHPVVLWAKASPHNLSWVRNYLEALGFEYILRFGKTHKSYKDTMRERRELIGFGSMGQATEFANCTRRNGFGVDFRHVTPVTEAYKLYLNARWKNDKREPKWTDREPPSWKV